MSVPRELLAGYVLGTLEADEVARVEAELRVSGEARSEVRALRAALFGLADDLPEVPAPPGGLERLRARLRSERVPAPRVRPTPRPPGQPQPRLWAGALAACLVLLVGLPLSWQTYRTYEGALADTQRLTRFLAERDVRRVALRGEGGQTLGSVLLAGGRALFVLAKAPGAGQAYQAWGHSHTDWKPGSSERLVSLRVVRDEVFEVGTGEFSALYLSLEPAGGSAQPTRPLSRVSLSGAAQADALVISQPPGGAVLTRPSVIVSGTVPGGSAQVRYALNGNPPVTTAAAGGRFTFTVGGLRPGRNEIRVDIPGVTGTDPQTVVVTFRPER
ncbi:hypothetical protein DAETH_34050 (plasmid) [Deinococcus aetherius]|uniref:Regulator of SigK n=1 Tax=Deinococcus aetherius TaxID=200252 RepID=A0ABM8AI08_9DEIO|nr:anti-sigma factor [Deinococcus aetherius]BDP43436.1 hypothetical protein DAETH_34050 [Deinococcus aetherius]